MILKFPLPTYNLDINIYIKTTKSNFVRYIQSFKQNIDDRIHTIDPDCETTIVYYSKINDHILLIPEENRINYNYNLANYKLNIKSKLITYDDRSTIYNIVNTYINENVHINDTIYIESCKFGSSGGMNEIYYFAPSRSHS